MHATLINLSDSIRVFPTSSGVKASIAVGKVAELDLEEAAIDFIKGSMKRGDQLLLVPPGTPVPDALGPALNLMAQFDNISYEVQLREYFKVIPARDGTDLRPTAIAMRRALRELVQTFIDRNFALLESAMNKPAPLPTDDDVKFTASMGLGQMRERAPSTTTDDLEDPAMKLATTMVEEAPSPEAPATKSKAATRSKAKKPPPKKGKTTRVRLRG